MRDRILAVLQGMEHDRVPFVQYDGNAAPNTAVWDLVGRENMGIIRWSGVSYAEQPNCRQSSESIMVDGSEGVRNTIYTPAGIMTEERFYEPVYRSSSARKHYVREPEDYYKLIAWLKDTVIKEDIAHYLKDYQELGEDGLPMAAIGRTPFQQLWVQWVGIEDLAWHLVEFPDLIEECVNLMNRIEDQNYEIVRKSPVPFIDFPDNITAPVIGLKNFEKYCVPRYNRLAEMLEDRHIPVFVHMDGDLKPLWNAIAACRVGGLDSFSPQPDNDTSVAQALKMWPEKRLFINFPSSVHIMSPDKIYSNAMQILEAGGHSGRLEIQLSENVPPWAWQTSIPQIVKAIKDYR